MGEQATELDWLRYFYCNADFGPAHGDVMFGIKAGFIAETGKQLPDGYEEENG